MHGYDYRAGSSTAMSALPPSSGPLGHPPAGHLGLHGNPHAIIGPDGIYQPPPPGLENAGHLPPSMGDPMGMLPNGGAGRQTGGNGGSMMSPPSGYIGDSGGIGSGHAPPNGTCNIENTSMVPLPLDSSGYTLTSLDTNSPMGSES